MTQAPRKTAPSAAGDGFGANDWLIDELREQYRADPASVEPAWSAFFAAEAPQPAASSTAPASEPAAAVSAPATGRQPTAEPTPEATEHTSPEGPGSGRGVSPDRPRTPQPVAKADSEPTRTPLRGAPARTAANMDASLAMPTATSVREVPMKLVIDQREMINSHLARSTGGKVSFTHLIGWAMVQALKAIPEMNNSYEVVDGKPFQVTPASINLGLAIDSKRPDGTRQLLVPNIKGCEDLDFAGFWSAYERLVARAREGSLGVDDFVGTTASLTNPGGLGTNHSVPRLMAGQGVILGVGSIDYPPEFQGASATRINQLAISKVTTLTSTYDHRVIQGAQSGEFLKRIHELLIGKHDFYDEIFDSLRVPYTPIRWPPTSVTTSWVRSRAVPGCSR